MAGYADLYALAPTRDAATLGRFLDRFAPAREESEIDYHVPQFSDRPTVVYRSAPDLIGHLVASPTEPHSIYWRNTSGSPDHVHAFFTGDGGLVLGLSCDPAAADRWFAELMTFAGSGVGYVTHEEPPAAGTVGEFRATAAARAPSPTR